MNRRNALQTISTVIGLGSVTAVGSTNRDQQSGSDTGPPEDTGGDIELLGEVETPGARELDVKGNYAYVGNGQLNQSDLENDDDPEPDTGFSGVDWSDPRNPELVRTVDVPGPEHSGVETGQIVGGAYDTLGGVEIHITDLSSPELVAGIAPPQVKRDDPTDAEPRRARHSAGADRQSARVTTGRRRRERRSRDGVDRTAAA